MQNAKLKIKLSVWKKLVTELKRRGFGKRETGAFLLGNGTENEITTFICYNDLDPHAFDSGIIIFNGDGYIPLWEYCSKQNLKVLADIHTHPGDWTGQSSSDMKHPMIAQKGHIALIVPQFATKRNQLLNGVGIHEFLGKQQWKAWEENDSIIKIIK
jgi:proteasome lid subunit RPN8/RPN11